MSTNLCIEDYDLPHYEEGQTMNLSYVDRNRIPHSTTQQNVSLDCPHPSYEHCLITYCPCFRPILMSYYI